MSTVALGDICRTTSGGTPSRKRTDFFEGSIPWVKSGELNDGLVSEVEEFITEDAIASSSAKVFPAGTLLIALYGATVGKLGILSRAAATNQAVCAVFPPSDLDTKFLFWNLRFRRSDLIAQAVGGAQPNISQTILRNMEIHVPRWETQREIVAEIEKQFSRLDEAVANLKRVKANLERQRSSVLQAVTGGGLAAEGQAAPAPEEWCWLTIDELASRAPRSIQSGPFGSNLRHSEFQASGKLVIGIDNVRNGEFSIGSNHRISEAKFKELEKYAARPGDVLITVMATIGRVCVVPQGIEPSIITKHVYRITVNRDLAIPDYVAIALRGSREVRAQLMNSAQGQTRPGLNGSLIKKIRVPLPPLPYQRSIVAEVERRLSIVREVEAEVDANLKRARALRQAILGKAFNGEGGA